MEDGSLATGKVTFEVLLANSPHSTMDGFGMGENNHEDEVPFAFPKNFSCFPYCIQLVFSPMQKV